MDKETIDALMADCDTNGDDLIERCEMFECMVRIENEFRRVNCPNYGLAYCKPLEDCCHPCPEEWDCATIIEKARELEAFFVDNNGLWADSDNYKSMIY
jgi:hypothetical protein